MDSRLDQLERLAALHRAGSLPDTEYEAQKATLLAYPTVDAEPQVSASSADEPQLSKTWKKRFAFFRAHGSPFSPTGALALKKLPVLTASAIRFNVWGFLFGPFYFFVLGMWKRGLALMGISIILTIASERLFGDTADRAVGVGCAAIFAMTANYYRFIKVTESRDEWNPLTDLFPGKQSGRMAS